MLNNIVMLMGILVLFLVWSPNVGTAQSTDTVQCTDLKMELERTYKTLCERYFRSCAELQNKTGTTMDGEYKLYPKYPTCEKAVNVYCADMKTAKPKEYITLKAGAGNNFALKDYMGSVAGNSKPSSNTTFDKIRINSNLTVERGDFRFAKVTWFQLKKTFVEYASGRDCSSWVCSTPKKGKFSMDLTGTGLLFHTPIVWKYSGYPTHCAGTQPIAYTEVGRKVVTGNCGGYCGQCDAQNLKLEIEGC